MTAVHGAAGVAELALCALAGGWGAWRWWRRLDTRGFWPLLRAAQVSILVQMGLGVVLLLSGRKAGDRLHVLYGVLPFVVMFFAEQLRAASAAIVLEARGMESATEVGDLPPEEQQAVVHAILRREMGVMAAAALVALALALRAAQTAGWT